MTARCTYHCSPCGRHFHSLRAFDLHHQRDATGWPVCLDPVDLLDRDGRPRLELVTDQGACSARPPLRTGVAIWTTAGAAERGARRYGTTPESCPQPPVAPSEPPTGTGGGG